MRRQCKYTRHKQNQYLYAHTCSVIIYSAENIKLQVAQNVFTGKQAYGDLEKNMIWHFCKQSTGGPLDVRFFSIYVLRVYVWSV